MFIGALLDVRTSLRWLSYRVLVFCMGSEHIGVARTIKVHENEELCQMLVVDSKAWCHMGNRADVKFGAYDLKTMTHIVSFLSLMCF